MFEKFVLIIAIFVFLLGGVYGADLSVKVLESDNVLLNEEEKSAFFTLQIKSNEQSTDNYQIYSIVGVQMFPKDKFTIKPGEVIELDIEAIPNEGVRERSIGDFKFQYEIKGQKSGIYKDVLTLKFRDLIDIINVSMNDINLDDEFATFSLTNNEELALEDLKVVIKSKFFDLSETLDLGPNGIQEFNSPIIKENIQALSAGEYESEILLEIDDKKSTKNLNFNYLEKGSISVHEDSVGLIVRKKQTIKTNNGNIDSIAQILIKKDILSRLFTTFSELPISVERKGLYVEYFWEKNISPSESYIVTTTTNYTLPFIILILIIVIIVLVKFLLLKPISIQKRVTPVNTKGGELALKVRVRVKARKTITGLTITDRLPRMTKLYNKFGAKPHHIDHNSRKISWNIHSLSTGEERSFTYIIYSKLNIVGRFELPAASVKYNFKDKTQTVYSNKTAYAAETNYEKID